MATKRVVPGQAASGKDTNSDNLVGFQITDGSSLMTNTSFAVERVIPEKDAKTFQTKPFSEFLTLDDLNQETIISTTGTTAGTNNDVKFYSSKDDGSKSLFGSLNARAGVSVKNIIENFPGALYVDSNSPVSVSNLSAESIVYDNITNITEFKVQLSLIYNPFDIVLKKPNSFETTSSSNTYRDFYSSYTKYLVDLGNESTYPIVSYT